MKALFGRVAASAFAAVMTSSAGAQSFGAMQVVAGVRVASVFHGHIGPTYVTFTPASLAGCNANAGGYLSTLWPSAMGGPIDSHAHGTQIALLLMAKATNATVEVRYRINSQGTGWDKCTIDAIFLQ
jgi:hypothetical protein